MIFTKFVGKSHKANPNQAQAFQFASENRASDNNVDSLYSKQNKKMLKITCRSLLLTLMTNEANLGH